MTKMNNIYKPNKLIVSVGATSRIAIEMQRRWAKEHHNFILVGRDKENLERIKRDLQCLGAGDIEVRSLEQAYPDITPDITLIALGSLSKQEKWQQCANYRENEWEINTLTVINWIEWAATKIEETKKGQIAVMTSVAADRPKKSNYGYGAAKAALDFYMLGVRHRLSKYKCKVQILKPGPTRSPMTQSMPNKKMADPKEVAKIFCSSIDNKKNNSITYAPKIWRVIMNIIKLCPEIVWNKTNL
jgi:short-subunit dehydrogenase